MTRQKVFSRRARGCRNLPLAMAPVQTEDLPIITRERVAFCDVAQRFSGTSRVEIRLDRRHGERRRAPHGSSSDERRRRDRRAPQVDDELRTVGWGFIPATHRAGDPLS